MSLLKKKCEYCEKKIEKGAEVFRDVKNPLFIDTKEKAFCCGHAFAFNIFLCVQYICLKPSHYLFVFIEKCVSSTVWSKFLTNCEVME